MGTLSIRVVHEDEVRRLQFYGPRDRSIVRDLNERLDEVALHCRSIDEMVDYTVQSLGERGYQPLS